MAARAVRRTAAVAVLVALFAGVGLFVGVWLLGDGGGDDPDPEADARATAEAAVPEVGTLADLADAVGCEVVQDRDDSSWVPVAGVESGDCELVRGAEAMVLHVAESDEAQADVLAYFELASEPWPEDIPHRGCPGDTPEEAAARNRYHLVVGDRWVVTTYDAEVAADVEDVLDGGPPPFSPAPQPPASYVPGGGPGPCPPA
jgi:hypothetical protein